MGQYCPIYVLFLTNKPKFAPGLYQNKKKMSCSTSFRFSVWVEDGAPMPTMESLLQVFTDHFSQYFSTYGLSVVTENIALYLRR